MTTASVFEAKSRLSALIQQVLVTGESVIVTRHGTPVAVLGPIVAANSSGISAWDLLRDDLVASLGGPPELVPRSAEPSIETTLPW